MVCCREVKRKFDNDYCIDNKYTNSDANNADDTIDTYGNAANNDDYNDNINDTWEGEETTREGRNS